MKTIQALLPLFLLAGLPAVFADCSDDDAAACADCRNNCGNTCAPNGGDSGAGAACSGCFTACASICSPCEQGTKTNCLDCNGYFDSTPGFGHCDGGSGKLCAFCLAIDLDNECSEDGCGGNDGNGRCAAPGPYQQCPCSHDHS